MKKATKVLVLGAAIVALAAPVNAAVIDFNIYGASAQFTFWNAAAPNFLTSVRKCAATTQTTYTNAGDPTNTGKHEITQGTGCDGGTNTINLRYSSKASYDGIRAVNNVDPANTCPGQPGQRPMITGQGVNTLTCQDVHLGASDVAGSTFDQEQSHGLLLGPLGGAQTDRVFTAIPTAGLTAYNPIVVPFGFFANNAIKVYTCDATSSHPGNLCTAGAAGTEIVDCGSPVLTRTCNGVVAGTACTVATQNVDCAAANPANICLPATITPHCAQDMLRNITREQVVQIFAGKTFAWTDFGASYSVTGDSSATVVACLRHAGSGTAATFNKVFYTGATPASIVTTASAASPIAYFNDGASDEMKCINNNAALTTPGAIGYADADQANLANTHSVMYNGLFGTRNTIRNGAYDFFSNQWLYENPTKTPLASAQHTLITDLNTYASNPTNLNAPAFVTNGKAVYWATQAEMVFNKSTDTTYPIWVGAGSPQVP
jgi:hypothetical protein